MRKIFFSLASATFAQPHLSFFHSAHLSRNITLCSQRTLILLKNIDSIFYEINWTRGFFKWFPPKFVCYVQRAMIPVGAHNIKKNKPGILKDARCLMCVNDFRWKRLKDIVWARVFIQGRIERNRVYLLLENRRAPTGLTVHAQCTVRLLNPTRAWDFSTW